MAQVTIEVDGRSYVLGCQDGQERSLIELAGLFDRQVRQVKASVGQLGETRLFLMGALMLADELADVRARLTRAETDLAQSRAEATRLETRAAAALDAAARRIEALSAKAKETA